MLTLLGYANGFEKSLIVTEKEAKTSSFKPTIWTENLAQNILYEKTDHDRSQEFHKEVN